MARKRHQQVHERLTEWADSAPPRPTPALAQFMGPLRPRAGVGSSRAVRAAVRTGVGIKVFGLLAAMAVTGAAAVGVTQVAQHEPVPPTPVVVPAAPSSTPDDPSTTGPVEDPSTSASASPSTTPTPRATPSASPSPRVHRTRSAAPAPSPRPSSHESEDPDPGSSEGTDQPGPTSDAADTASVDTAPAD